ncbi:MAG: helix-turn-helix transcriptional regulator [Gammaproteobacteria bacterium]|nr:helix-turn-helix transcriptional regulator [Gammaproteobacteria bacterium]MDH4314637.1 helix-turn-helix transcriptional regulator [Gammaproteobacteria bacterium]MDH5212873.1 helix-turn-helix transcriptional regulator [Gammaproteobacteria bacterium]MDH5500696.1 helix-turn-helix transcriptional regulator [Gammaproteobacteria bacterium]
MRSKFESAEWHQAVANVVAGTDHAAIADALVSAIGLVVDHEGTCLLAIHSNASPDVVHHTLEPAGRKHYLERYLAGPYLLDPLYQLALKSDKPSLCRFRDQLPDRFRASEYYKQYCERTHLLDEMDYLLPVSDETTLVLVIGRRTHTFSKAELSRLQLTEPLIRAGMQRIWQDWAKNADYHVTDDRVHRRLTECFERFGESLLTEREQQISQLLLRGYSSKSIARELKIAPGTVMVHKRNLFAKLGISSQYELFSLLINALESGSRKPGSRGQGGPA